MGGRGGTGASEEELAGLGCVEEKYDALGRMVAAVRALEDDGGKPVEAIVPVEMGASNVPGPIAAALELGVPLVDGDYAGGRAIPEVPQTMPEIHGVPSCPLSFVTRWGDVVIVRDTVSTAMVDRIGRHILVAAQGGVGVSCYLLPVTRAREVMAHGTLTRALRVGQAIWKPGRRELTRGGPPSERSKAGCCLWVWCPARRSQIRNPTPLGSGATNLQGWSTTREVPSESGTRTSTTSAGSTTCLL